MCSSDLRAHLTRAGGAGQVVAFEPGAALLAAGGAVLRQAAQVFEKKVGGRVDVLRESGHERATGRREKVERADCLALARFFRRARRLSRLRAAVKQQ